MSEGVSYWTRYLEDCNIYTNNSLPYIKQIWEKANAFHMVKKIMIVSKGQITLPKDLRDKYNMSYGKSVILSDSGEGIIIKHGNGI